MKPFICILCAICDYECFYVIRAFFPSLPPAGGRAVSVTRTSRTGIKSNHPQLRSESIDFRRLTTAHRGATSCFDFRYRLSTKCCCWATITHALPVHALDGRTSPRCRFSQVSLRHATAAAAHLACVSCHEHRLPSALAFTSSRALTQCSGRAAAGAHKAPARPRAAARGRARGWRPGQRGPYPDTATTRHASTRGITSPTACSHSSESATPPSWSCRRARSTGDLWLPRPVPPAF